MNKIFVMLVLCLVFGGGLARAEEWTRESPGQKAYYDAAGNLKRVLLDADRDGRFEAEEQYAGRRLSRREDRDGDGIHERRYDWQKDGSARLVEDRGKGPIQTTWFDPKGVIVKVARDKDRDGKPEITWRYEKGVLRKVEKNRGTWFYQNGKLARAELDTDKDGRTDRREYYRQGRLERSEDLGRSGKVHRKWFFDEAGKPLRQQEDSDGDGRMERLRVYRKDGSVIQTVDADLNGKPEIRERYAPDGRMVSREEDLDGDGEFDLRSGRLKE